MIRLMIVDDEVLVRVGMKSLLDWESHGYTIVGEASNGRQALELIETRKPDIVFTDLVMDRMDGFTLIETCHERYPEIRFVVLSSYNDFDNVKRAMKLGAVDYFFKLDTNAEALLKVLDEVSAQIRQGPAKETDLEREAVLRKNLHAIKRQMIVQVVEQLYTNESELIREFKVLGLPISFSKPFVVLYLCIDNYALVETGDRDQKMEVPLLKFSMENMMEELFSTQFEAYIFDYLGGDMIAVIATREDADRQEVDQQIEKIFDTGREYIKRYLGIEVSGCVSAPLQGIEQVGPAVKHMGRRLRSQAPLDKKQLHRYEENTREEISVAKKYIVDHLAEELSVARLAKVVNMSESYFSHLFKKSLGMSFVDYMHTMRLQKAMELLVQSDMLVNEVAAAVGIENTNYFSTLFKKATGLSPNQFRQMRITALDIP